MRSPKGKERRSQVVQMCEEVASRVERAARRLRPPAWFRAAAASPRGFLLAARRPSRLPPWPLPELQHQQQTHQQPTAGGEPSASGSRSAPATLTRRRDRQRAADAAEEETWSRDAATLYATPLSSRRHRPQSDWQTAPLGGWDSTPPRRHRSQLTLRTTSPAPASDAGWSQEVRRPYMGWRSLERLSRRPWTPEERLAASLLERSGRSTPTSGKEATAAEKQSAGTRQPQPSDAGASRGRPASSSLRNETARTPTSPVTSGRTEHSPHSHKQFKEPSPLSRRITTLSVPATERNRDIETPSSAGSRSTELNEVSTGSLAQRPAEEDSSRKGHTRHENSLQQDTLPNVSGYPEVKRHENQHHNGTPLSTQTKTLTVRATDAAGDLALASYEDPPRDQPDDTQNFRSAEGNTLEKVQYREKTPEKVPDRPSRDTREEKPKTVDHQYLNGPSQLPTQLKALSVTTHYSSDAGDMSTKVNDKHFPAGDLLARSYDTAPFHASNVPESAKTTSAPTTSNGDDYSRTINHLNSTTSPSLHKHTFTADQSLVSDNGDVRLKQLPTVELRTRSLEVTLPQRVTTSDTSRKFSIQEQFWIGENRSPSAVQEDPSLLILPLVKQTVATVPAPHSSSISFRKSAPTFPTSSPIDASPGAATDTKTLPHPVQIDNNTNTSFPSASETNTFDLSQLRSVELRTRSVEIPLPQVSSVITDPPGSDFSHSSATENPSVPSMKEARHQSSATIRAVSVPPVPRDRTFCIESPSVLDKGTSTFSRLPAVEFQSPPSNVTLLQEVSTIATAKPNSHRQQTEPILAERGHGHSVPASPLIETSVTTIHVTPSPVLEEYQAVYPDSSPLLGRKPFTVKHVEAPSGHRTKSSAGNTKTRDVSLSSALPKPFEPIPHSKIPVPSGTKPFPEKETTITAQTETSHSPLNHIHPAERTQKSSLPVTSVIRRPSYRVATRSESNPLSRKKRSAAGVNTAEVTVSTAVVPPTVNPRIKTAPIAKPPRLRTKDNATSTPKPPPRQKHTTETRAALRSDYVEPIPHNTELHLPNGMSPLPYSALRILDTQLPQKSTGPTNSMSVSFKLPVSSESDNSATKGTSSQQSKPPIQHVPNPSLLTPLKYKPCTTTDL